MPNYIYPEAIEAYAASKFKKLPADYRDLIVSKTVKYAKANDSFAVQSALLIKCSSLTNSLNLLIFRQTKGVDLI